MDEGFFGGAEAPSSSSAIMLPQDEDIKDRSGYANSHARMRL